MKDISAPPMELPKEFSDRWPETKFWYYRQIKANDRAYLYEVWPTSGITHYDVFLKRLDKRFNKLLYPTAKRLGVDLWRFDSLKEARKKLNEVTR